MLHHGSRGLGVHASIVSRVGMMRVSVMRHVSFGNVGRLELLELAPVSYSVGFSTPRGHHMELT